MSSAAECKDEYGKMTRIPFFHSLFILAEVEVDAKVLQLSELKICWELGMSANIGVDNFTIIIILYGRILMDRYPSLQHRNLINVT